MTESLGPYELQRLLGRGGMGEVHLARDTKLGRDVALKLLPADFSANEERRARFLREARASAGLNHPNITTIHDVGEAEGRAYIAQEYVDGRQLAEIVRERKLGVEELADLAVPLADALAYAHEHGVVHRDLKAANVMVNDRGHPKLLDFGLAKVMNEERGAGGDASTTLTIQGAIFGTPSAMSPEQALGKTVDARSDVFSFGSLLYEMAAGKPAFLGTTVQETMDKVIHATPEPLAKLRRDLPTEFTGIVEKALRKEADARYQRMEDLAADLRHFKRSTDSGLVPPAQASAGSGAWRFLFKVFLIGLGLVGLVVAALLGWALVVPGEESTESNSGSFFDADTDVEAPATPTELFAAVMYVENMTDPSDAQHLGAMLAHLLTTDLASAQDLRMLSQQRLYEIAVRLGREDGLVDRAVASEVAREGGVGTMLLGQVVTVGDRMLATVTLVDSNTGADLGAARAEGEGEADLFGMAEELGAQVRIALGGRARVGEASLEETLTSSVDAYRAFVRGQDSMRQWKFQEASEAFGEAVELDPAFALANFWLGLCLQWGFGAVDDSLRAIERAAAFPERLPKELGEIVAATAEFIRGRYEVSRDTLERVLVHDPDNKVAVYLLGEMYTHSSMHADPREAARHFARTLEIDPGFGFVGNHLVSALAMDGRGDEARALVEEWELDDVARAKLLSTIAWRLGDIDEALRLAEVAGEALPWAASLDPDFTLMLERLRARRETLSPVAALGLDSHGLAPALSRAGRFDEALELLGRMPVSLQDAYDWEANCWAEARRDEAELHGLRGDWGRARQALAQAMARQPMAPFTRYVDARFAARIGELDVIREHVAWMRAQLASGLPRNVVLPTYLDATEAELALAEGDAARARSLLERAVARDHFMADWWTTNSTAGPRVREALARACFAVGDVPAARASYEQILERRDELRVHSITVPITRYALGVLELESGDEARGRELLELFLRDWGEADWELPQIEDARERLGG